MAEELRPVRGKLLEIAEPTATERMWIFRSLAAPAVHQPLGCRAAPTQALFAAGLLELWRGEVMRREPVRYHLLRRLSDRQPIGFFLDFGWDFAHDPTREIDLVVPSPQDRGLGVYVDATVIVAQYLFTNGLAKRLRWRVELKRGVMPRRSERQGARLLWRQQERHPVTGEWVEQVVYEYALADFESLGHKQQLDPRVDYQATSARVFDAYRASKPKG